MSCGSASFTEASEPRNLRAVRALIWLGILFTVLVFWLLAGWLAWTFLRP